MRVAPAAPGGISFGALAALVVLYFAAPGHRDLLVHGVPLGPEGTAIAAVAVVLGVVFRGVRFERRTFFAIGGTVVLLMMARVILGLLSTPSGWTARYFANDRWAGTPEWSSDYRNLAATRIDRLIDFRDNTFPAHYLNDYAFNYGDRREVSEPMSVEWRGFSAFRAPRTIQMALITRGAASVSVDGQVVLHMSSAPGAVRMGSVETALDSGMHEFIIRYVKPPNAAGLIDLQADVAEAGAHEPTELLFGAQGWWQAGRFAGRMVSLNALDDWFAYESRAREIPWNDGYRLILPPFVYATTLSVAAFASLIGRRVPTFDAALPGAAAGPAPRG